MKRFILFLGVLGVLSGCLSLRAGTVSLVSPSADGERCRQWVDSVFAGLDTHGKVGQLVVATLPTASDKAAKKQIRELVKNGKIGGLLFSGGSVEEQTILTNIARKSARIPVMVAFDGETGRTRHQEGGPDYLPNVPLGCIRDSELLAAYEREVGRQFRTLGVHTRLIPDGDTDANGVFPAMRVSFFHEDASGAMAELMEDEIGSKALLLDAEAAGYDMLWVQSDAKSVVQKLVQAVEAGRLSREELDAKCRKVLAYKYGLGLRSRQPSLRVSGMSFRLHPAEARTLAAGLRRSAITVLNNYFDVLPLAGGEEGNIALLSIGEKGLDAPFAERMQQNAAVRVFHLPWAADEAARQAVVQQLAAFRRVVVSIAGDTYIGSGDVAFLESLNLRAPLVYACFTSYRTLLSLEPALVRSSAVVLAHSAANDLQAYVADVLFAKAAAAGRMPVNIGRLFPPETGCVIQPGMSPAPYVPEDYGMKSYVLQGIDGIARKGLSAGAYPGCRVLVWKEGQPVYDKGFGTHSDKDTTAVRPSDLFDLGGVTRTAATLLAVMKLYDQGKIGLDDKASRYLPLLRNGNKRDITLRHLLLHEAGLPPYIRFYLDIIDPNSVQGPYSQSWKDKWHRTRVSEHGYYCSDFKFKKGLMAARRSSTHTLQVAEGMWLNKSFKSSVLQAIARSEQGGRRYVDSDPGFILLQQVVEAVAGMPMDAFLEKEFYVPIGLRRTLFLPLSRFPKAEIMPTATDDYLRRQDLCGYVYDEAAACLGGVAGHAGLFSTVHEVAAIYQMLLDGGEWNGKRLLSEETCRLFTTEKSAISRRGLGFDKPDLTVVKYNPCAASAPASVYGHTGFTGTCAWADPENKIVYVFLSNRLCPHAWNTTLGDLNIRTDIQELIYKSLK